MLDTSIPVLIIIIIIIIMVLLIIGQLDCICPQAIMLSMIPC